MSRVITDRAAKLDEFLKRLEWNDWTKHSSHPHSTYWEPPAGVVDVHGLGWSQICVPNETHHEFDYLLDAAWKRFHEWWRLVTRIDVELDPTDEVEYRELVIKFLSSRGCILWGRAFDVEANPEDAADWFIKNMTDLAVFALGNGVRA